jgi:hypothetical protein
MAVVAAAACGGGSSGSTPTSPSTPTVSPPSSVSACGVLGAADRSSPQIIHGSDCSPVNSPVVLLNLKDEGGFASGACTGTIIGPRAVLTAAHCLAGETRSVKIYLGVGGDQITAASFQFHPRYSGTGASSLDVGLVFTAEDIGRPGVPLLLSRDARAGEQAIIAGWGNNELGNGTTLRAGLTTITMVGPTYLETQLTNTTAGVCSGDSGGPIFLSEGGTWAVAGVTSATSLGGSCIDATNYYVNLRNPDASAFILDRVPGAGRR